MHKIFAIFAILAAMSGGILTGCVAVMPPPPLPSEKIIVSERPGEIWMRGHWQWSFWQHRYIWVPGHWKGHRDHMRIIVR